MTTLRNIAKSNFIQDLCAALSAFAFIAAAIFWAPYFAG